MEPDLRGPYGSGQHDKLWLERKRWRTLFSALVGVTHDGSSSAASMSKNSPSESNTLDDIM